MGQQRSGQQEPGPESGFYYQDSVLVNPQGGSAEIHVTGNVTDGDGTYYYSSHLVGT